MSGVLMKLMGEGPYPFSHLEYEKIVDCHISSNVVLISNKTPFCMQQDRTGHSHESYEFLIPEEPMPYTGVEGKLMPIGCNVIFPLNSWQPHGPLKTMDHCVLTAIQIDKVFLCNIARQMLNTSSSNFSFKNTEMELGNDIKAILNQFKVEAESRQAGCGFILDSLSIQLTVNLLRYSEKHREKEPHNLRPTSKRRMDRVIDYLRAHYNCSNYSTSDIAKLANLSSYHFIRVFREETGMTPYEYLMDIKIEKALEMLSRSEYSITEVCFLCGFTNHSHFTTTFKRRTGLSPTQYRNILNRK